MTMEFASSDTSYYNGDDEASDCGSVDSDIVTEMISSVALRLKLAESEYNPEKKTLFATHIWHGSRTLANYIATCLEKDRLEGSSILEFGAGAAIPSLVAHYQNAAFVCASDYPVESLISVLEENIERNHCRSEHRDIKVIGYKWDSDITPVLALNCGNKYDIVLASECLWRHEQHEILVSSIVAALRPGGFAVIAYSHHIPGQESEDDHFFEVARRYNLEVVKRTSFKQPHMWANSREVDMYVCEMLFKA